MTTCEICGKSACDGCAEYRKQTTDALKAAWDGIFKALEDIENGDLSYGKGFSRIAAIIEATGEA